MPSSKHTLIVASTAALLLSGGALLSCTASGGNVNGSGFGGSSGSSSDHGTNTNSGSSSLTNSGSGGGLQITGSGGTSGSSTNTNSGSGGGCAGSKVKASLKPLDMFIMLDQSGSMSDMVAGGTTKWAAITQALDTFVQQPAAAGLGVGLGYFGVPPGGATMCPTACNKNTNPCPTGCGTCIPFINQCSGSASGSDSCNAADYAKPAVEIGPLPGAANAQSKAIINSIGMHMPTTSTPTAPALQGAINHASSWAVANPTHVVIDVLATDGDPTECNPQDIPSIANIAAAGVAATPSIKTFVIGVGTDTSNLNALAAGGGTTQAFIVDTTQDVTMQFLAALNQIRGAVLACTYLIPKPTNGMMENFDQVNVEYTPGSGGSTETLPKVADLSHCPGSGDAWYYDNNAAPTEIIMCPAACTKLSMDSTGQVDIVLGCQTMVE